MEKSYKQKVLERLDRNEKMVMQKQRAIARDKEILGGLCEDSGKIQTKHQKQSKTISKNEKVTEKRTNTETVEMPIELKTKKSILDEIFED